MGYPPSPFTPASTHSAPTIDRSDKHRVWQVVAGIVLFIVSQFLIYVPLGFYKSEQGESFTQLIPGTVPEAWAFFAGTILGAVVTIIGYLLIIRFIGRRPGLGLRGGKPALELLTGIAVGAGLIALSVGIIWLLGGYQVDGINTWSAMSVTVITALGVGVGPGFVEETLFRGFLLRTLDAVWGWFPALALTSVLFGVVHLANPEGTVIGALGIIFQAGILLGAAYFITRRLWLSIGIHAGWNSVQAGIFGSDVSGTGDQTGFIKATWDGPAWLTGGSMGMEGSLISIAVATAAGVALLYLARSHGMLLPRVPKAERKKAHSDSTPDERPNTKP